MIYISTQQSKAKQCPKGVWFSGFVVASFQRPPLFLVSEQRILWQWTTIRILRHPHPKNRPLKPHHTPPETICVWPGNRVIDNNSCSAPMRIIQKRPRGGGRRRTNNCLLQCSSVALVWCIFQSIHCPFSPTWNTFLKQRKRKQQQLKKNMLHLNN